MISRRLHFLRPTLIGLKPISLALFSGMLWLTSAHAEVASEPFASSSQPSKPTLVGNPNNAINECELNILNQLDGVTFKYNATVNSVSVKSERTINSLENDAWEMQSRANWLFLGIEEKSVFDLPSWQLREFEHKRKGMGDGKDLTIKADYQQHTYVSESAKGENTVMFDNELHDALNYQLRLQLDVACNAPQVQEQGVDYTIAKKRGVKEYHFEIVGNDVIDTDVGKFEALLIEKRDSEDDRATRVWLAKDLAYSIVKLEHTEDGQTNSLSISDVPRLNAIKQDLSER
ncbi:DUF3108 domain-containing protein [Sessilibacter sp. MAH4]